MATTHFQSTPVQTVGDLPIVGSIAPDFTLVKQDLSELKLSDLQGKRVVLNIFPSIDTPVCSASVRRFNKDVSSLDNTVVVCVSEDLPFAAARFCAANDIKNVITASAFRSDFGVKYGVQMADGPLKGLLARAVIILDTDGRVLGTSLCDEITEEPDYDYIARVLKM